MKKKPTPFKIEWEAHEHAYKERSPDWFWAVGILAVSIAIVAIILSNVIFGILVLIATFTLMLSINKEPEIVHAAVTETGITKGKVHYPYSSLASYWLDSEHPHPKLLLRSKKFFLPLIVVPMGNANAVEIDKALAEFLPEEEQSLPLLEKMLEVLGF